MRPRFLSVNKADANDDARGGDEVGLVEPTVCAATAGIVISAPARCRPPFFTLARKLFLTLLGLGVIGAIVGQTMQGTHSAFTATAVNSGNSFAAGTLQMSNSLGSCTNVIASACGKIFSISLAMTPGTPQSSTATITNSGTLPASMSLQVTNIQNVGAGTSAGFINLTIYDGGNVANGLIINTCVYPTPAALGACPTLLNMAPTNTSSLLGAATASPISLSGSGPGGRWGAGESHTFTFYVEVCGSGTCTQGTVAPTGQQVTFDVIWTAIQ